MRFASKSRRCLQLLTLLLVPVILICLVSATEVILIKSPGCQKCAAAERVVVGLQEENLTIVKYDYFSDEGHSIIKECKAKDVPSLIIGCRVIGYRDYDGDNQVLEGLIKEALINQINETAGDGGAKVDGYGNIAGNATDNNQSINQSSGGLGEGLDLNLNRLSLSTISAVLIAGLLAGFNPCLLGILVFLAASVLSSAGRKRELVLMVIFFSLGIFTMYFLFGLGMQRLLQAELVAVGFRYILTVFLVVLGLLHIEDARRLNHGRESLFRTDWTMKYVEAGLSRGRLSSYFLIGALFSLVKAPCVGAVYLAILDLISSKSYFDGTVYLLFYNLGIILPIILLGTFIALGMSPEQVDVFRKGHRANIRLVTGLTLILLAPLIYWQII